MSQRFTVTRSVSVKQAIVIKADSEAKAIELSRKTKFKDWATENAERSNYKAVPFSA